MLLRKSFRQVAISVLFASMLTTPASAVVAKGDGGGQSSSGTAELTANIPEFIVLHYYGTLSLNFETPTSEALNEGDATMKVAWDGSSSGNELGTSSLMNAELELDGTTTTVTLNNVWAVRGFSKSGNAEVSIVIPSGGDELTLDKSIITMSNAKVSDGRKTGASIETNLGGIAKSAATIGSILIDLDFSKTTLAGSHAGGKYTITAETI
ncbi:hypothetical protein CR161_05370 [Prosthecochloris sp. ZM]|uniref:hypothetical protein n=1 Tax=Prosthecochloris sp. ZM TaxID=2283143 RepID=UPI000DF74BC7|nr:hypothetical protein [Prosthecochloris sp. ZM]RDD30183.1 hypothetical protein CR161_05370 [Prosthecochloris sp. ZM]